MGGVKFDVSWPQDPRLDPFRNAVWELSRRGRAEAYLTCRVIPTRSFPMIWAKGELLWYRVNWLNGRRDRPQEDYGPNWPVVTELEKGRFEHDDIRNAVFDARPVEGLERDHLWQQYGLPS
jgi:hypothetical protein